MKAKERFHRAGVVMLAVAIIAGVGWVIAMSALSLFANGTIYHVDQPVPVISIDYDAGEVLLRYTRFSRFEMAGVCERELQCERLFQFGARPCPIEHGASCFLLDMPLPEQAAGECKYRGVVSYRPLGAFGPRLTHLWESEPFVADWPQAKE